MSERINSGSGLHLSFRSEPKLVGYGYGDHSYQTGIVQMNSLLRIIMIWLSVNFELPATTEVPEVVFADGTTLTLIIRGELYHKHEAEVVAGYRGDKRTIFIGEKWQKDDVTTSAILVHEMVHHMQYWGGIRYPCPAAREALAFQAQEAWLQLFGRSLKSEFGMDSFTLKAITVCVH